MNNMSGSDNGSVASGSEKVSRLARRARMRAARSAARERMVAEIVELKKAARDKDKELRNIKERANTAENRVVRLIQRHEIYRNAMKGAINPQERRTTEGGPTSPDEQPDPVWMQSIEALADRKGLETEMAIGARVQGFETRERAWNQERVLLLQKLNEANSIASGEAQQNAKQETDELVENLKIIKKEHESAVERSQQAGKTVFALQQLAQQKQEKLQSLEKKLVTVKEEIASCILVQELEEQNQKLAKLLADANAKLESRVSDIDIAKEKTSEMKRRARIYKEELEDFRQTTVEDPGLKRKLVELQNLKVQASKFPQGEEVFKYQHVALGKRAADTVLYHPEKRIKTTYEIEVPSNVIDDDMAEFLGRIHRGVLCEAAVGGLINPLHFKVSPDNGLVTLTPDGLKMCDIHRNSPTHRKAVEDWTAEKAAELGKTLKEQLKKRGLATHGHSLVTKLNRDLRGEMTIGNMVEDLRHIDTETRVTRENLRERLEELKREPIISFTSGFCERVAHLASRLYRKHRVELMFSARHYHLNRERLAGLLQTTLNNYDFLAQEALRIEEGGRLPDYFHTGKLPDFDDLEVCEETVLDICHPLDDWE